MKDSKLLAKKIFEAVERDLRDRRGLRHEWDRIEDDIQKEIRETNEANIAKILKRVKSK